MKRIVSLLLATACLAASAWAGENPPAEWQQALAQLQARIEQLSAQIQAQSAQLTAQQAEIQRLRNAMAGPASPEVPKPGQVASAMPVLPPESVAPRPSALGAPLGEGEAAKPSPLSFRVGTAHITPLGFMDFTVFTRTTAVGSSIGTNFASIPFNNTPAGRLSETRFSAQNSRIGLRVDADVRGAHVLGYLESDFLGSAPGNLVVSSNSDPLRMRLYWADLRWKQWEILGGQSWTMLTPNRRGLSALPGDLFYSQVVDTNYQLGLTWARDPQFRLIYHPTSSVAWGVSLENPEQYIGGSAGGGLVTLPSTLASSYANQLNNGGTTSAVPNLHPDIISKIALDGNPGNHAVHFEVAGVLRSFRTYNPLSRTSFTTTGGGGSVNFNAELAKNFRLFANTYFSDGGGRWVFGQAPDLIIRGDGSPSLIHAYSTVDGFEYTRKNTLYYGYYGGLYIGRNSAIDPATGRLVGYGYSGSPSSNNRAIHEGTFGIIQTFWKDAKYGALSLLTQYSYLTRSPWFVAAGQPKSAHTSMVFVNLRYALPGAPPPAK